MNSPATGPADCGARPNIAKKPAPTWQRTAPIALILAAAAAVISLDLHQYLSFDSLRAHRQLLSTIVSNHAVAAGFGFVGIYALSPAVSLPGGAVLSIAGGFLFGGVAGGALVVAGATLGATGVFLAARTVLGDSLRRKAGPWLRRMESGFNENALSYMLVLRLVPLFPFFVVNLVPAFLGVRLHTYILATAIGIVPGSLAFTFTGAGIGAILDSGHGFSVSSVLTPEVVAALCGLGVLALIPVVYKRIRSRRGIST